MDEQPIEMEEPGEEPKKAAHQRPRRHIIAKILAFVFTTIIILAAALLGLMWILVNGPSPTARDLFVRSVRETSAIGFLANIYLSDAEIEEIEAKGRSELPPDATDTSLVTVAVNREDAPDPDGDGIEVVDVSGPSFHGKLMIVADPGRIFVGLPDYFGGSGMTLKQMIDKTGAVAGVNGGGFYDPGGNGNGGDPDGIVISEGVLQFDRGHRYSTVGIDGDGVLHVGDMTGQEALAANLQWAVSFGPTLVVNGEKCSNLESGLNPRTVIGQRADGAILLMVIDGRQIDSLGASYGDVADLMLENGAVNAYNLDGGSSTMMYYNGELLNTCASVIGPRALPTAILVRGEAEA